MPISNIVRPEILPAGSSLRLRKYDCRFAFAPHWYRDVETLLLVNGKADPYDLSRLERMYSYWDEHGELFFIEALQECSFA
jgi:hypothetical protein